MNFPDPNLPPFVIVDDSEDDAFLLRYRLRQGGIANPVVSFTDPVAAREYVAASYIVNAPPQLLFVDIRMAGGYNLIAELREDARFDDTRIVVFTYSNDPLDVKRGLQMRIDGYILKFPDPDILAEFVAHGPWFEISRPRPEAKRHVLCA